MTTATHTLASPRLTALGGGVFSAPGARIIDRSGRKRMPIGWADFVEAVRRGVLVDKTMLIADVLDKLYKATLFCRPRRFGKTLNMTMLKAFLEAPEAGGLSREEALAVFEHTEVWDAEGGAYREHQGEYPVVHLDLSDTGRVTWGDSLAAIEAEITREFMRHSYLCEGDVLSEFERRSFDLIASGQASEADYGFSLTSLCHMLRKYHGHQVVLLIDGCDAPCVAARRYGFYEKMERFLDCWLAVGAMESDGATAFTLVAGVQFAFDNTEFNAFYNFVPVTPARAEFSDRFGFTDAEVGALLAYMGYAGYLQETLEWYGGYRFGETDICNPLSIVNCIDNDCRTSVYWPNFVDNSAVDELVRRADGWMLRNLYTLLRDDGSIMAHLELSVVYSNIPFYEYKVWGMLYLLGYITTFHVDGSTRMMRERPFRLPNQEIRTLFHGLIVARFAEFAARGFANLHWLQHAFVTGNADRFTHELSRAFAYSFDSELVDGLAGLMMLTGLLFGISGYGDPDFNYEIGDRRLGIQLRPAAGGAVAAKSRPLVTIELKFLRPDDAPEDPTARDAALRELAEAGLAQIAETGYDAELPAGAQGRLRWGVAFSGKHVAAACERGDAA